MKVSGLARTSSRPLYRSWMHRGRIALPAAAGPPGPVREPVQDHPADVVARLRVLVARVPQADDELHVPARTSTAATRTRVRTRRTAPGRRPTGLGGHGTALPTRGTCVRPGGGWGLRVHRRPIALERAVTGAAREPSHDRTGSGPGCRGRREHHLGRPHARASPHRPRPAGSCATGSRGHARAHRDCSARRSLRGSVAERSGHARHARSLRGRRRDHRAGHHDHPRHAGAVRHPRPDDLDRGLLGRDPRGRRSPAHEVGQGRGGRGHRLPADRPRRARRGRPRHEARVPAAADIHRRIRGGDDRAGAAVDATEPRRPVPDLAGSRGRDRRGDLGSHDGLAAARRRDDPRRRRDGSPGQHRHRGRLRPGRRGRGGLRAALHDRSRCRRPVRGRRQDDGLRPGRAPGQGARLHGHGDPRAATVGHRPGHGRGRRLPIRDRGRCASGVTVRLSRAFVEASPRERAAITIDVDGPRTRAHRRRSRSPSTGWPGSRRRWMPGRRSGRPRSGRGSPRRHRSRRMAWTGCSRQASRFGPSRTTSTGSSCRAALRGLVPGHGVPGRRAAPGRAPGDGHRHLHAARRRASRPCGSTTSRRSGRRSGPRVTIDGLRLGRHRQPRAAGRPDAVGRPRRRERRRSDRDGRGPPRLTVGLPARGRRGLLRRMRSTRTATTPGGACSPATAAATAPPTP